jgi:hypothetical protein
MKRIFVILMLLAVSCGLFGQVKRIGGRVVPNYPGDSLAFRVVIINGINIDSLVRANAIYFDTRIDSVIRYCVTSNVDSSIFVTVTRLGNVVGPKIDSIRAKYLIALLPSWEDTLILLETQYRTNTLLNSKMNIFSLIDSTFWNIAYGWGDWHHTTLAGYGITDAAPSSTVSFPGFGTSGSTAAYGNHTHDYSGTFLGINATAAKAIILENTRAIYGNNFDGSAALTGIIASTYGGTGNGFTKFAGAATSEKTYTLPNASCNILTDNAVVTVAQGGIGTSVLSRDIVADSSMISLNDTIQFFITTKAIVLDSIKVKCRATTASIVIDYRYGTGSTLAGTAIITSPAASTNTTTGTLVTSFDNGSIPANNYIWFLFPTITTKPKQTHITFYYH